MNRLFEFDDRYEKEEVEKNLPATLKSTKKANRRINLFASTVLQGSKIWLERLNEESSSQFKPRSKAGDWNDHLRGVLDKAGTGRFVFHESNPERKKLIYIKVQSSKGIKPIYYEIPNNIDYRTKDRATKRKVKEEMLKHWNIIDPYYMIVQVRRHPSNANNPVAFTWGRYKDFDDIKYWKVDMKNASTNKHPRFDRIRLVNKKVMKNANTVRSNYANLIAAFNTIVKQ